MTLSDVFQKRSYNLFLTERIGDFKIMGIFVVVVDYWTKNVIAHSILEIFIGDFIFFDLSAAGPFLPAGSSTTSIKKYALLKQTKAWWGA